MRAALMEAPNADLVVVDDVEIDDPRPGEVRVTVSNCGVCHSDLHILDGSIPAGVPMILGHEAAGVVEAVGAGVSDLAVGDKVLLSLRPPCNRCYFCVRGEPQLCAVTSGTIMGTFADGSTRLSHKGRVVFRGVGLGAFAEQVVLPVSGAIKVPDDTPLEIACVLGCSVQTGVGAVLNTAKVEEGATVLVFGLGGIGISIVQGARIAGARTIVGVDPVESRRERAKHFGATDVLDPGAGDPAGSVFGLTDGIGVDYAFDAVGRAALAEACLNAVRPGGTAVMVGVAKMEEQVQVPAVFHAMSEKKLIGCFLGSSNPAREFPRLLGLWRSGQLDLEGMITARRPLDQINQAFDDLKAGEGLRTAISLS